jgi:hypothetical protein
MPHIQARSYIYHGDFAVLMMTKTDSRGAVIGGDYRMLPLARADEVIE